MNQKLPIIGITLGDPTGIGPEIVRKALSNSSIYKLCRPVVIGDACVLETASELHDGNLSINVITAPEDGKYEHGTIDLICESELGKGAVSFGKPDGDTGRAMIAYINKATDLAIEKKTDAVVTAPINKLAMKLAGSKFHGHTELIATRTDCCDYAMMMAGERLSVVLVTIHIPFSSITGALSKEQITKTILITGNALKQRFGINVPKIAIAGLNPHCGEEGLFGEEETRLIEPAVKAAENYGFELYGPLPPDTVFFQAAEGKYDAVVCMYHDQGLIPFKMIHFSDGVNTTIGLPIIRTSVDHGTAYDIAGKGIADEKSMIEAIKLAAKQAENLHE